MVGLALSSQSVLSISSHKERRKPIVVATKKVDAPYSFDIFVKDEENFEGHFQINGDTLAGFFADIESLKAYLTEKKYQSKEMNPSWKKPTYVTQKFQTNSGTPFAATDADMTKALEAVGGGKNCPVDDTPMNWTPARQGVLVKNGPFAGQQLADSWTCPKCQKKVWVKK
jgi:hypothetical protein